MTSQQALLQMPLLIYDGNCGFCKASVACLRKRAGESLAFASFQEVANQFPQIPQEECTKSVKLIFPDGTVLSGAEAIFSVLSLNSSFWKIIAWKYKHIPGCRAVSEWVYGIVARNRSSSCAAHAHH